MAIDEDSLPVGITTERLDTTKVTQTDGTVTHREAVVITDPLEILRRANVIRSTPTLRKTDEKNEYAAAVADIRMNRLISAVETLVEQNETIILHLESMSN